jgi:hypothetical protein
MISLCDHNELWSPFKLKISCESSKKRLIIGDPCLLGVFFGDDSDSQCKT